MKKSSLLFAVCVVVMLCSLTSCIPYYTRLQPQWIVRDTAALAKAAQGNCADWRGYVPDTLHPEFNAKRRILVNFHILRDDNGRNNFSEKEGKEYVWYFVNDANNAFKNNYKMNLPVGNNTPVLPINIEYVVDKNETNPNENAIYYYNDSELCWYVQKGKRYNMTNAKMYEKYGKRKEKVLNVFMVANDSIEIQQRTYKFGGIAFPGQNWMKMNGCYQAQCCDTLDKKTGLTKGSWFTHSTFNHENLHLMGLLHSWSGDQCEDTPNHANCWDNTSGKPPCDGVYSNNVMDYNNQTRALSPCQIAVAHANLSNKTHPIRKVVMPDWCALDTTKTIHIREDITWIGAKDLLGNLVIEDGGTLTLRCRVSIPPKGHILVKNGGRLILDGATLESDCEGAQWKGIFVEKAGKERGQVVYVREPILQHIQPNSSLTELNNIEVILPR